MGVMPMSTAREPTDGEKAAIHDGIEQLWDKEVADTFREDTDDHYPLFIIDSYTTDMPGYSGPVGVQLFGEGSALVFGLWEDPDTGEIDRAEPLNTDRINL